jgi:hypothetical protein
MAIARYYKVGVFDTSTPLATGASVATTTPTGILAGLLAATTDINISAVRASCLGAASFPSNASVAVSLNIATTTITGGNAASPRLLGGGSALASQTPWKTAGGTSATVLTGGFVLSTFLWSQELPFTAGANWGEWFSPGFEANVAASAQVVLYVTQSSAGTGTTFTGEVEYTE